MDDPSCCPTPQKAAPVSLQAYRPLILIVATIFVAALALHAGGFSFMHAFMGLFLSLFALFKLLDLNGFAAGFAQYDLLAKRFPAYARAYPFIELALGLAYLAYILPGLTYLLTFAVMGIGAAGIFKALREKRTLDCACLGTVLPLPLGTVSLVETVSMAAMALLMLIF